MNTGTPNPSAAGAIILDYILWQAERKNHHSNQKETADETCNTLPDDQTAHYSLQLHTGNNSGNGRGNRNRPTNRRRSKVGSKNRAGRKTVKRPSVSVN